MKEVGKSRYPWKRSVPNANLLAYRRLSGLIGFRRPLKFGLFRPSSFMERPCLARPMAYRPAYERPGPLGTLDIIMKNVELPSLQIFITRKLCYPARGKLGLRELFFIVPLPSHLREGFLDVLVRSSIIRVLPISDNQHLCLSSHTYSTPTPLFFTS